MEITYKGHDKRKREAELLAKTVVAEYTSTDINLSVIDIAKRHINPKTNKPYSREHIHLILRRAGVMKK